MLWYIWCFYASIECDNIPNIFIWIGIKMFLAGYIYLYMLKFWCDNCKTFEVPLFAYINLKSNLATALHMMLQGFWMISLMMYALPFLLIQEQAEDLRFWQSLPTLVVTRSSFSLPMWYRLLQCLSYDYDLWFWLMRLRVCQ